MILRSPQRNTTKTPIFRTWSCDVLEVKNLFFDRKYRRCAARCEELLVDAVHPLHKTFLSFYQALCYESLGVAAHMFSNSKIQMLESARERFGVALDNLPLPFDEQHRTEEDCGSPCTGNNASPACATLAIMKRYQFPSPVAVTANLGWIQSDSEVSPAYTTFSTNSEDGHDSNDENIAGISGYMLRERGSSVSSTCSHSHHDSRLDCVPDFDAYSPRQDCFEPSPLRPQRATAIQDTPKARMATPVATVTPVNLVLDSSKPVVSSQSTTTTSNHKARLSQSLSSTHCLADHLIPSPLFNRTLKVNETVDEEPSNAEPHALTPVQSIPAKETDESDSTSDPDSNSEHELEPEAVSAELIDSATPLQPQRDLHDRPLPPLPFNHKPHFKKRGSRHILIPSSHLALTTANLAHDNTTHASPNTNLRKSAIQTLVAKFEGKIQESKSYTDLTKALTSPVPPTTPITPRFKMISRVFEVHNNSQHQDNQCSDHTHAPPTTHDVNTPALHPIPAQTNLPSTTSSPINDATSQVLPQDTSNLNLNLHLSSFRTALLSHLSSIETRISKATRLQKERKARGVARSMSFWSFDVHGDADKDGTKRMRRTRERQT